MSNFDHFIGTRAVSEQHAFDTAALSAWLQKNLDGFEGPLSVEMFKGGQSNPTYKLITPRQSYVMRAKPGPVAKLLPSAHAIEREFAVMSGLAATSVPVPRMYALCEDESIIGRAFYIMECMQGRVLWDQSLPGMQPAERAAIYDETNRVISALHSVKFAQQGLANYGKPGNYFERQIGRWSKQYQASITQPIPEMDQLMAWLPANIPAAARDESMVSIVHGDYRLDNLMFHPDGTVAAVDWQTLGVGLAGRDLAYLIATSLEPDARQRGHHVLAPDERGQRQAVRERFPERREVGDDPERLLRAAAPYLQRDEMAEVVDAVAALAGVGTGLASPSRDMLIKRAAPPGATGRVYGTVYSGLDLGFCLAAPVFGALLDRGMTSGIFYGSAITLALSVVSAALVGVGVAARLRRAAAVAA